MDPTLATCLDIIICSVLSTVIFISFNFLICHCRRLQLARFEWYDFSDLSKFHDQMLPLIKRIKEVVGSEDEHVAHTWFGGHTEGSDQDTASKARGG
jgi:hypothetical protein